MHLFFIWWLRITSVAGIVAIAKGRDSNLIAVLATVFSLITLAASFVLR